ncbi:hypothetical protein C2845_PM09G19230 [Panicum miliaceum]|uniref:Uncharacterized protein n=1 Tax=Panicum miliaceum TaxID=4540 RepID=A0A3L6RZ59_PANMI|nr:hypothetical protein C2845_PM09G19230 [Panicum miliaceum]
MAPPVPEDDQDAADDVVHACFAEVRHARLSRAERRAQQAAAEAAAAAARAAAAASAPAPGATEGEQLPPRTGDAPFPFR